MPCSTSDTTRPGPQLLELSATRDEFDISIYICSKRHVFGHTTPHSSPRKHAVFGTDALLPLGEVELRKSVQGGGYLVASNAVYYVLL